MSEYFCDFFVFELKTRMRQTDRQTDGRKGNNRNADSREQ